MDDQEPVRLPDGFEYGLLVVGQQRPQVEHFRLHPLAGQGLGGVQAVKDHLAVGDDRRVAALPPDRRLADGHGVILAGDLFPDPGEPVEALVFEEEHRVVVADRRLEQALRVVGRSRRHDLEAGHLAEPGFGVLGVEGAGVADGPGGTPDHEGHGRAPAVVGLGHVVDQLIEPAGDEVGELHFGHGPHAHERRAHGRADDHGLRHGRVDHPVLAEIVQESLRDLEGPAVDPDVLAETEDAFISLHLLAESGRYGFQVGYGWHGSVPGGDVSPRRRLRALLRVRAGDSVPRNRPRRRRCP